MMKNVVMPPSVILKQMFFDLGNGQVTDDFICNAAKKVHLTVRIWLDHLSQVVRNRKRGAAKAAVTRQKKKSELNCVENASGSKKRS